MFLDFLAVAISSCSFVQHLVISNSSPNCPPPSAGADALRDGGVLASQPASCLARGHVPPPLSPQPLLRVGGQFLLGKPLSVLGRRKEGVPRVPRCSSLAGSGAEVWVG